MWNTLEDRIKFGMEIDVRVISALGFMTMIIIMIFGAR